MHTHLMRLCSVHSATLSLIKVLFPKVEMQVMVPSDKPANRRTMRNIARAKSLSVWRERRCVVSHEIRLEIDYSSSFYYQYTYLKKMYVAITETLGIARLVTSTWPQAYLENISPVSLGDSRAI